MTLNLIPILVLSLLSGLGAWFFQAARLGAELADVRLEASQLRADVSAEQLAGERRARELESHFNEKTAKAADAARDRERADAVRLAAIRADGERMRNERDEAIGRFAQATAEAKAEYASALNAVFGECQVEYQSMAAAAAGHATDAQQLWDGWPVSPDPAN